MISRYEFIIVNLHLDLAWYIPINIVYIKFRYFFTLSVIIWSWSKICIPSRIGNRSCYVLSTLDTT